MDYDFEQQKPPKLTEDEYLELRDDTVRQMDELIRSLSRLARQYGTLLGSAEESFVAMRKERAAWKARATEHREDHDHPTGLVHRAMFEQVRDCAAINARQRDEALEHLEVIKKDRDAWKARATELEAKKVGNALQEANKALDNDEQIYCATYGAMVARLVMDHINEGRGAPTGGDMDGFVEEAEAVSVMTLDAARRCREASKEDK